MTFAKWLQLKLLQHNWSQAELARRSHVSEATISRVLLRGNIPGPDIVKAIADALGESTDLALELAGIVRLNDIPTDVTTEQRELFRELAKLAPEERKLVLEQLGTMIAWTKKLRSRNE